MYEIGALESKSPRPPRLRRVQAGAGFLRPQQPRPVAAWRPCQPSDSGKGCVAGARRPAFQRPPRRSGKSGRPMIEAGRPFGRPEWPRVRSGCRAQGLWAVLAVVVGGGLLLPRLTGATTVLAYSFASLVQAAEVIAVGTVTAIENRWDAEKEAPFTLVTFSDLEVLKGEVSQSTWTLHFLGGPTPDGRTLQLVGVPQFRVGERCIVFSAGNEHQAVPLVGLWQGVYRVEFDAQRGVATVHDHAGQPVTRFPAEEGQLLHHRGRRPSAPAAAASAAMSLPAFTQQIEQEVDSGR